MQSHAIRAHVIRPSVYIMQKRNVVTRSALPQTVEFINTYVCPIVANCQHMFIGNEEHQLTVINQAADIARKYNIVHGEGWVIRALFQDDMQLALKIAKALDQYNTGAEAVREAISHVPSLPNLPSV